MTCALAAMAVVFAGLLLRSGLFPLPHFLVKYGADSLWAVVVFLCGALLFPRASTRRVAIGALVFSWSVEVLQLYHAPGIDAVRATLPGRLVLGSSFNPPDLLAYFVGIAVAAYGDSMSQRRKRARNGTPAERSAG